MLKSHTRISRALLTLAATSVLGLFVLFTPTLAFAATTNGVKCGKSDTQCFITFGDKAIAARQSSLETLSDKITAQRKTSNITDDQVAALQADVATNHKDLATLKARLDADKNAQAARQDVEAIYTQFRIYAVVLPRDYRRLHVDVEIVVRGKLVNLEPKLQQAIQHASASKQAKLNPLYNDYKARLASAEGQIDSAQRLFPELTPTNFNLNRSIYEAALAKLKTSESAAHNDLHKAGDDLHQITQILK
jgi:septal ring factor EnvC (AmiA/AmiB activator)